MRNFVSFLNKVEEQYVTLFTFLKDTYLKGFKIYHFSLFKELYLPFFLKGISNLNFRFSFHF